jgi:hypothetical protein
MPEYMLFIRDSEDYPELTPEQIQQAVQRYRDWSRRLAAEGRLVEADKLTDGDGRILYKRNGSIVVDGPFTETKEAIGGYFRIKAADFEEAIEIAKRCPAFDQGGKVELRQIES